MATLGGVFGSLQAFLSKLGHTLIGRAAPPEHAHLQQPLQQFLFGFQWLGNGGSHHRRAMYNAEKEELYVEFKSGQIYTVEKVTLAEATAYWQASSKGTWYWDHVRVRGEGHGRLTQKPYRKGLG